MNWRESIVHQDAQSVTTPRHLILRGSNHEIGMKLAEIATKRHGLSVKSVASTNPLISKVQLGFLSNNYPALLERSKGVAQVLGVDLYDDRYDVTQLSYNLDLPIIPSPIGCSVVQFPPDTTEAGHGFISRNYDFPIGTLADMLGLSLAPEVRQSLKPMMSDPYIVEVYPENVGFPSLYMCGFDLLSGVLSGINSKGLVVSLNGDELAMINSQGELNPNTTEVGLNEVQILRLLLDTCSNVEEAKQVLLATKQYYSFVPCHYLIADSSGKSFVYEHSHCRNREYIIESDGKPQVLTNHPLYKYPTQQDIPEKTGIHEVGTSSFERYARLVKALQKSPPPYTTEFVKTICSEVTVSQVLAWTPKEIRQQLIAQPGLSRTLWHALYDTTDLTLDVKFYKNETLNNDAIPTPSYTDYSEFTLKER